MILCDFNMNFKHMKSAEILAINDDCIDGLFDIEFLSKSGYQINKSESAVALKAYSKFNAPDLFIINFNYPEGFEVISGIHERYPNSGIIAVIPSLNGMGRTKIFDSGSDNYIVRPFASEEMLLIVKNLLNRIRKE